MKKMLGFLIILPLVVQSPLRAQLSPEEVQAIEAAAPSQPTRQPLRARKLLVFNRFEGYQHTAIAYAARALEVLGRKTGAFEVTQSDDMAMFAPENLGRFDAVCFNNTTWLAFDNPAHRKSLLDFVSGGKGVVGIHAATDNFRTWPEAVELFGGQFLDHPWTADGTWAVKVEDPAHPLTAAFQGKDFLVRDEIYRIRQVNLRSNARVLLGLDMKSERNRAVHGLSVTERDMPISWVRTVGRGRLFYCSIGHNSEIYWNPAMLRHYLDGIQFALGDYPVDTTPIPFDPMTFFSQDSLEVLVKNLETYRYGDSRAAMAGLDAFIRNIADLPDARSRIETRFLSLLEGSATPDAKQYVCQKLAQIGSAASVPALAAMLENSATQEMALFALEVIPGAAADDVLLSMTAQSTGRDLVGILSALGNRKVERAVPAIRKHLTAEDPALVAASASALAAIGSADALQALREGARGAAGPGRESISEARLAAADRLRSTGKSEDALRMYQDLAADSVPRPVQRAALLGILRTDRAHEDSIVTAVLRGGRPDLQAAVLQHVANVPSSSCAKTVAPLYPGLPAPVQVQLLGAISRWHEPEIQKTLLAGLQSKHRPVRLAALRALGSAGDATVVRPLAHTAASTKGEEQKTARRSLTLLQGPGVDDSVIVLLSAVRGVEKTELIRCAGERTIDAAVPGLLGGAKDRAENIRRESARSLKLIAPGDRVADLTALLLGEPSGSVRTELELATVAAAGKIEDPARRDSAVLNFLPAARTVEARLSLIRVLGKIGAPNSLPPLRAALQDKESEVRLASVRALSEWPTAEPLPDLQGVAATGKEQTHRVIALRGSVRLLALDTTRATEEVAMLYQRAMTAAPNLQERKTLLSLIGQARSLAALRSAASYLDDHDLRQEAEVAVLDIAGGIADRCGSDVTSSVRRVAETSANEQNTRRARSLLEQIERASKGEAR